MTRHEEDALRERVNALEKTLNGNGSMGTAQKNEILWRMMIAWSAILCAAIGSLFNAIINGWFAK